MKGSELPLANTAAGLTVMGVQDGRNVQVPSAVLQEPGGTLTSTAVDVIFATCKSTGARTLTFKVLHREICWVFACQLCTAWTDVMNGACAFLHVPCLCCLHQNTAAVLMP